MAKTFHFKVDGRLCIQPFSFAAKDNDPPHRRSVLASAKIGTDTVSVSTNIRKNVWWLTGGGNGFAGDGCSRAINSVCTRNPELYVRWRQAIENGNVEILQHGV